MHQSLLVAHSLFRWAVLIALLFSIYKAWQGHRKLLPFTKTDNSLRHWTATITHIQLLLGIILYTQSAVAKAMVSEIKNGWSDPVFFGLVHLSLMLTAVVFITIGSAKAKRVLSDSDKFKTMLTFFLIGLCIILIAIPWPFSPLAQRPYLRHF
ncbi:hypothetical protein [Flavobacterium sp. AG291]|uniref:hypothetical protein n=1 Tax=Flavobacterium sp. AG291 TaxID=2184000 RepID=UPI000E0A0793|nr:hypothetical protein [Flavobacterium sp. AG291]RDI15971.1 hypothetical protein DEU42_101267 [Flavobacterium sp. AG291]